MTDTECPTCGKVTNFRNIMSHDDDVEIIGIMYMLGCKVCDNAFLTEVRMAKEASNKQMKQIFKDLKKIIKKE